MRRCSVMVHVTMDVPEDLSLEERKAYAKKVVATAFKSNFAKKEKKPRVKKKDDTLAALAKVFSSFRI